MILSPENRLPTSMPLFRFSSGELQPLQKLLSDAGSLTSQRNESTQKFRSLLDSYKRRSEIFSPIITELRDDYLKKQTPVTVGEAYIKMHAELVESGVPEAAMFSFFKQCLNFNITLTEIRFQNKNKYGTSESIVSEYSRQTQNLQMVELRELKTKFTKAPSWFKGSIVDWQIFALKHADFAAYLDTDGEAEKVHKQIQMGDVQAMRRSYSISKSTFRDFLPDWIIDSDGVPPDIAEVKTELDEDKEEVEVTEKRLNDVTSQTDHLYTNIGKKTMGAVLWTEKSYRTLFPKIGNLAELLIYLNTTDRCNRTLVPIDVIEKTPYEQWNRIVTPPGEVFEAAIRSFTRSGALFATPDMTALYIEHALRTSTLVQNAAEQEGSTIVPVLGQILSDRQFTMTGLTRSEETRIQSVIRKILHPLARLLSADSKNYLLEYSSTMRSEPAAEFIWEFAYALSSEVIHRSSDRDVVKAVDDIRKRSAQWIRSNWREAYCYLSERLTIADANSGDNLQKETDTVQSLLKEPEEIEEASQLERQFIAGNLDGWTLRYAQNNTSDEKQLMDVAGGTTLEDRQRDFAHFVRSNNIPCAIKPESVIKALNWLVAAPKEAEQIRMRTQVGDEEFKKLKRGSLRIFYQMDPRAKQIIFFIYQKKSWDYRF